MKRTTTTLALLAAIILLPVAARGGITTVPAGLNPGDQYRLVFVTTNLKYGPNNGIEGSYSDIEIYNQEVSNAANAVPELADLGTEWKVIGSTSAVNARQNTNTDPILGGVPIFLLNGSQMATNYADLWDVSQKGRDVNITETGAELRTIVWTGTNNDGLASPQALGTGDPIFGNSEPSTGTHRPFAPGYNGWMLDWADVSWQRAGLYAMSGVLTVPPDPGVVPEPVSMLTWCGLALTAYWGKTARRRRV